MRRPVPRFLFAAPTFGAAMMNKPTIESYHPENPTPENPRPNFSKCSSSDPSRSESPPSSPGPAGDVSPPRSPPWSQDVWATDFSPKSSDFQSDSQRDVVEWGDTFVPETQESTVDVVDSAGDVAAGNSEAARLAGCIVPDTYDPTPVDLDPVLSGPTPLDMAVAEEEKKQKIWEEKMWQMLQRIKAKESAQMLEKIKAEASILVAEEKKEKIWDEKIEQMLERMKAKESVQMLEKIKAKASVISDP